MNRTDRKRKNNNGHQTNVQPPQDSIDKIQVNPS